MKTYLSNLKRVNFPFHCEVVKEPRHIQDVLLVEQSVFPSHMQDSLETLTSAFSEESAHGLVLYLNKKPIGVMKGHHICEESTDVALLESSDLKDIQDVTFYMDSIGVLPSDRSIEALDFLVHEMSVDMRRFNYQFVSAHARVKTGLTRLYQRRYKAKVLARYDDWAGFGEPFDYVLIDLKNVPVLPKVRRKLYRALRLLYRKFKT